MTMLIILIFILAYFLPCIGFTTRANSAKLQAANARSWKLIPHRISLANGKWFDLNIPEGFAIAVAAQGLKRVRFMAKSPDDRIFVTDMYNLTDNKRGVVYILDEFDLVTKSFKKVVPYLTGLRNQTASPFTRIATASTGYTWP